MAGAASQYWRADRERIRAETAEARIAHGELADDLAALREQDGTMNSEVLSAMRDLACRVADCAGRANGLGEVPAQQKKGSERS